MIDSENSDKDLTIHEESKRNLPELFRNDPRNELSEEELRNHLASVIKSYLNNSLNDLMNIFYRIDLDENSVKHAFKLDSEEAIAEHLAMLVIERQKQKILLRQKFKNAS